MRHLDPELGQPLPEKSYGGNCRIYDADHPEDPFHNFKVISLCIVALFCDLDRNILCEFCSTCCYWQTVSRFEILGDAKGLPSDDACQQLKVISVWML